MRLFICESRSSAASRAAQASAAAVRRSIKRSNPYFISRAGGPRKVRGLLASGAASAARSAAARRVSPRRRCLEAFLVLIDVCLVSLRVHKRIWIPRAALLQLLVLLRHI